MERQIAISIEPINDNQTGQIRGVLDYVQRRPHLRVYKQGAVPYLPLYALKDWEGDGAISYATTVAQQELLAKLPYPVVCVDLHQPPYAGVPVVHSNNHAIGRAAAEHLLELGLQRFAFVGHLAWYHNERRLAGFEETVKKAGHVCHRVNVTFQRKRQRRSGPSDLNLATLERALGKLTPPVGIFAAHDEFAHDVVELLQATGVRVPYDAAVIGVNNYRLICETTEPPLSSIAQSAQTIGYEAARLLDKLMRGGRPPKRPTLLPIGKLVARRSTDYSAIDDELVSRAVQYIRANCWRPISTTDVLADVRVSRRTLDMRLTAALGHPAAKEIRLARIKRARELLGTTDMQIVMVGLSCGYESPGGFGRAFREATGMTPQEYRRQVCVGDGNEED